MTCSKPQLCNNFALAHCKPVPHKRRSDQNTHTNNLWISVNAFFEASVWDSLRFNKSDIQVYANVLFLRLSPPTISLKESSKQSEKWSRQHICNPLKSNPVAPSGFLERCLKSKRLTESIKELFRLSWSFSILRTSLSCFKHPLQWSQNVKKTPNNHVISYSSNF